MKMHSIVQAESMISIGNSLKKILGISYQCVPRKRIVKLFNIQDRHELSDTLDSGRSVAIIPGDTGALDGRPSIHAHLDYFCKKGACFSLQPSTKFNIKIIS